jgi:beta-glucosidase
MDMKSVKPLPYKNPSLALEQRVEDLLSRMTLTQKIAQLNCSMSMGGAFDNPELQLANGIGEIAIMLGGRTAVDTARLVESIQRFLVEQTELGIPAILHIEALSGAVIPEATNFPVAIGLGATWDPEKIQAMADVIRKQMKAVGIRQALSPVMDIARDPRWGRIGETYGENSTLGAEMSVAYVRGIQGDDLEEGIAATSKHFLGYGLSQGGLNLAHSPITPRELREEFGKPFEAAIRKAGLAAVMNSYNAIDNEPIIISKAILTDLLRGEMGFDGLTVSDYAAINRVKDIFKITENYTQAGILAIEAGMDVELPAPVAYGTDFREAVKRGDLDVAFIDAAVRRVLALKFKLGLFENPYPDLESLPTVFHQVADDELSYELAKESLVLVKNEGDLLPLNPTGKKIAVIGPNADSLRNIFGNYTFPAFLEIALEMAPELANLLNTLAGPSTGAMTAELTSPMPPLDQILTMMYPMAKTVLQALREACGPENVTYVKGCSIKDPDRSGFAEAVKGAAEADLVVMVMGAKNGHVPKTSSIGEALDSSSIGLPGVQEELIKVVHAAGRPVVLVHMSARPLYSEWASRNIPAILEVWHPGQSSGTVITEALFGKVNPGGKLPFTIIKHAGLIPCYADHQNGSGYDDRGGLPIYIEGGYINESGVPLYPFGHGLSYTTFSINGLELSNAAIPPDGAIKIACTVTNTGNREGDQVVQLYVSDRCASMVRPNKELGGFKRLTLKPGESRKVIFTIHPSQLAFLNKQMQWVVEAGEVDFFIGASSADPVLKGSFKITDSVILPGSSREYFAEATLSEAVALMETG